MRQGQACETPHSLVTTPQPCVDRNVCASRPVPVRSPSWADDPSASTSLGGTLGLGASTGDSRLPDAAGRLPDAAGWTLSSISGARAFGAADWTVSPTGPLSRFPATLRTSGLRSKARRSSTSGGLIRFAPQRPRRRDRDRARDAQGSPSRMRGWPPPRPVPRPCRRGRERSRPRAASLPEPRSSPGPRPPSMLTTEPRARARGHRDRLPSHPVFRAGSPSRPARVARSWPRRRVTRRRRALELPTFRPPERDPLAARRLRHRSGGPVAAR